jgi:hypothetical protein
MIFPKIIKLQIRKNTNLFLIRLDQWLLKHNLSFETLPNITNQDKIFMSMVYEHYDYSNVDTVVIPKFKDILPQADILLIVDDYCNYVFNSVSEVHKIPYFLVNTYIRIYYDLHPINISWNDSSKKALFLIGKSEKINRIGLLAKLYDAGQLEKIEWSLYVNEGIIKKLRNILSHYSDEEFDNFLSTCVKDLDPIKKQLQPESSHYDGFPYDVKLYENTLLSIISETDYDSPEVWITEKTWRAIANSHPFVMASVPGTLKKLKLMGFKTFENYMKIEEYDSILNNQDRLTAIVENIEFFIDNYHIYKDNIRADAEHNVRKFQEIANAEIVKLQKFMQLNNCPVLDTVNIIKQYHFREDQT